ncbi:hypothetical protein RRG08_013519 [Elysia crispata]|uniref:Uncharacterized protein n=1 Tax=Elysia crispata TaxID=231223 RepID=A0AAE1CR31_9GAST|nr:hypothetical protein RRG08_013519 [Elysia crispata]
MSRIISRLPKNCIGNGIEQRFPSALRARVIHCDKASVCRAETRARGDVSDLRHDGAHDPGPDRECEFRDTGVMDSNPSHNQSEDTAFVSWTAHRNKDDTKVLFLDFPDLDDDWGKTANSAGLSIPRQVIMILLIPPLINVAFHVDSLVPGSARGKLIGRYDDRHGLTVWYLAMAGPSSSPRGVKWTYLSLAKLVKVEQLEVLIISNVSLSTSAVVRLI